MKRGTVHPIPALVTSAEGLRLSAGMRRGDEWKETTNRRADKRRTREDKKISKVMKINETEIIYEKSSYLPCHHI